MGRILQRNKLFAVNLYPATIILSIYTDNKRVIQQKGNRVKSLKRLLPLHTLRSCGRWLLLFKK